jgi:hypothetical protein
MEARWQPKAIEELRKDSARFYNYMVYQTLNQIPGLHDADVRLDGNPGKNRESLGFQIRRNPPLSRDCEKEHHPVPIRRRVSVYPRLYGVFSMLPSTFS